MSGKKKSTKAVFEERCFMVMEMILSGLKRREIVENIAKNEDLKWEVTESQIDNYIKNANESILKSLEKDKEKLLAKFNARYDFLYKKSIDVKDYKNATLITEKTANLFGVNAPAKTEITGSLSIAPKIEIEL